MSAGSLDSRAKLERRAQGVGLLVLSLGCDMGNRAQKTKEW